MKNKKYNISKIIPIEKLRYKIDFKKDNWFLLNKYKGKRCFISAYDYKGISENGKEIKVSKNILNELKKLNFKDFIFDGIISNDIYIIHDMIILYDFYADENFNTFGERFEILKYYTGFLTDYKYIKLNQIIKVDSIEHFNILYQKYYKNNNDGLYLKKDIIYNSSIKNDFIDICNYKTFKSTIKAVEFSIVDRNKKGNDIHGLTSFYVRYKNESIEIKNNFDLKDQIKYYKNKNYFFNDKSVIIKYLCEFKNKNKFNSLDLQGIIIDKIITNSKYTKNKFWNILKYFIWRKKEC